MEADKDHRMMRCDVCYINITSPITTILLSRYHTTTTTSTTTTHVNFEEI
jgi:hypothetical protein